MAFSPKDHASHLADYLSEVDIEMTFLWDQERQPTFDEGPHLIEIWIQNEKFTIGEDNGRLFIHSDFLERVENALQD